MSNEGQLLPLARTEALVIKELQDEMLVYDLKRHKAHCLNPTAAIVRRHCDGKTTVAEMTRLLESELGTLVGEDVVWLALNQLRKFHLLEESETVGMMKVSRRDLVRKYLPAAMVLPVILSVPAPTAAQAASLPCGSGGASCSNPGDPPCCDGFTCDGTCFPT